MMMNRLLIHVEGQTEVRFVREVLAPHLYAVGWQGVAARLVGNSRLRTHRGGITAWTAVKKDIMHHLRQDPGCCATTMVDYYALPQSGDKAWPGRAKANELLHCQKAPHVEAELADDLTQAMGPRFNPLRFIPFVVMHEFEALLFSDCEAFSRGIGQPELHRGLQAVRDAFASPEEINDSPMTAPSKQVEALVSDYQKPLHGPAAASVIGLPSMREACPHFGGWLSRLEKIVV